MATTGEPHVFREIARLSIPNVIANITVPIMGMADIAIAGHVGGDLTIGAVAIGTTVFNMIYRNCSFLRMGCGGVTAQAYGAGRKEECVLTGLRCLLIAMVLSALLWIFGNPIRQLSLDLMGGGGELMSEASIYVTTRWWAIPASVSLFAVNGWFAGMQDAKTPMLVAILGNVFNVSASAAFAIWGEMGIAGIALGTVTAQWVSLLLSFVIYKFKYSGIMPRVVMRNIIERAAFARLMKVNRDIFLRTLCLVIVFTAFTAYSSDYGETALAANALMMQMFTLFSYLIDGLAYAGESVTGRFIGAGDQDKLRRSVDCIMICGLTTAIIYTIGFGFFWREIFSMFGASDTAILYAGVHIGWGVAVPIVCFYAFVADGIMVGATRSKAMRDSMAISSALFFTIYLSLRGVWGVNALWLSFLTYMAMRGALLAREVGRVRNGVG